MELTDERINSLHHKWMSGVSDDDAPEISRVNEKVRALWVLKITHGSMRPSSAMSLYMIRPDIAEEVLTEFSVLESVPAQKPRRDKYSAIQEWCKENVSAHTSPKELAEIGEISYPTALKYISDHPDVFWKIGHGAYEVRDPEQDRKDARKQS